MATPPKGDRRRRFREEAPAPVEPALTLDDENLDVALDDAEAPRRKARWPRAHGQADVE